MMLQPMLEKLLPVLSSRIFMISDLTFRSLIHFELIFVYKKVVQFHSFAYSCPVFPRPFVEQTAYSSLFCCRLIDHIIIDLYLSSLFCSIEPCVFFLCQYHTVLITIALECILKSGIVVPPVLFSFFFSFLSLCTYFERERVQVGKGQRERETPKLTLCGQCRAQFGA